MSERDVMNRALSHMQEKWGFGAADAARALSAITDAGLFLCTAEVANKAFDTDTDTDTEGCLVDGVEIDGEWEPMVSITISEHQELVDKASSDREKLLRIKQTVDAMHADPDGADFYRHVAPEAVFAIEKIITGKKHEYSPGTKLLDGIQEALRRLGNDPEYYEADAEMVGHLAGLNPDLPRLINEYLKEVSNG
jgi:hypothetical protein